MRREEARLIRAGRYLGLTPVKKALLLSLVGFGNKPKFPSKTYLARELLCSPATIKRAKTELLRAGLITIQKRGQDGKQQSDLWSIDGFEKAADEVLGLLSEKEKNPNRHELVRIIDERLAEITHQYTKIRARGRDKKIIPFRLGVGQNDPPGGSN